MAQSVQLLGYGPDGPGFEFQRGKKPVTFVTVLDFL
jgi:hypothetical protein